MEAAAQGMITTVAVAECGCAVEAGAAGFSIRQCPTHAAAPAMLAALEAVSLWMLDNDDVGGGGCPFCGIHANEQSACDVDETNACARVRAALTLVRGGVVRP